MGRENTIDWLQGARAHWRLARRFNSLTGAVVVQCGTAYTCVVHKSGLSTCYYVDNVKVPNISE